MKWPNDLNIANEEVYVSQYVLIRYGCLFCKEQQ